MPKDKLVEENFVDMLAMLKRKVKEKDEEIERLRQENKFLKDKFLKGQELVDETIKRRQLQKSEYEINNAVKTVFVKLMFNHITNGKI